MWVLSHPIAKKSSSNWIFFPRLRLGGKQCDRNHHLWPKLLRCTLQMMVCKRSFLSNRGKKRACPSQCVWGLVFCSLTLCFISVHLVQGFFLLVKSLRIDQHHETLQSKKLFQYTNFIQFLSAFPLENYGEPPRLRRFGQNCFMLLHWISLMMCFCAIGTTGRHWLITTLEMWPSTFLVRDPKF